MLETVTPQNRPAEICGFCGIAIYSSELTAEFSGNWIDYKQKVTGTASFVLCDECWERVKTALKGDIDSALKRRKQLFEGGKVVNRQEDDRKIPQYEDHICDLHYCGIKEDHGKFYDIWRCSICNREEWRS